MDPWPTATKASLTHSVVTPHSSGCENTSLNEPVPLLHTWYNEVDNLIRDMRVDIMKEIKLAITTAISSQISEIAKAMATAPVEFAHKDGLLILPQ